MDKPGFVAEAATKIYVGGDRVCRCGCAGNYYARGTEKFDKALKRFARLWPKYEIGKYDVGDNYLNIRTSNPERVEPTAKGRALTVYFD